MQTPFVPPTAPARGPVSRQRRRAWISLALVLLSGCASNEPRPRGGAGDAGAEAGPPATPRFTFDTGAGGTIARVLRDGATLVSVPADGIALGRLPVVDDVTSYDPVALHGGAGSAPEGLEWTTPSRIDAPEDGGSGDVALTFASGERVTLRISSDAEGRVGIELVPESELPAVAYFRLAVTTSTDEAFYGLGEYFDAVNHRGRIRAMQLELDGATESGYNEAHVPVPLVVGTRGWGLLVESRRPMVFDVAKGAPDRVSVDVGVGLAASEGLRFHLFAAAHPLDVTRHYHDVTGRPALPGRWALGPLLWRDENRDQAEVLADAETLRDLDLATTGMWIDRPYASGVNSFDFEAARFPDPAGMMARVRALGLRMALWHTPYLDPDDPATAALRARAEAGGFFPLQTGLIFHGWGAPIDLTSPPAREFWQSGLDAYRSLGVEGYKLDYGEDVVLGLPPLRTVWRFADGSDERTAHRSFQDAYHRTYADLLPAEGGFLLCRSSGIGDQARASVIWPGDLDATLAQHGEPASDGAESYVSVGGLPAAVIAGLSLGPSGFPLFGSDTGGYRHAPPDEETFVRWFEHTALSPMMQVGTGSNTVPWELAENGFSPRVLELYRSYARLHLRLWPYLWSYVVRNQEDGRPIARALGLAHPELGVHPDDEYLLGDHLLVAPVVTRGATSRTVQFPPGEWVDYFTGERTVGPRERVVEAPLEVLPLYLRAGAPVPLLRPTIDSLSPTEEPARVDSYATTPGTLHVRLARGAAATFELFDGGRLAQTPEGGGLALTRSPGSELRERLVVELIAEPSAPREVLVDGVAARRAASAEEALASPVAAHHHDASATGGTLTVLLPEGARRLLVR